MTSPEIRALADKVVSAYALAKKRVVIAESCTGGLIAAALTDVPGSSKVLERGFVAYSNDAKVEVLGLQVETLQEYGAVSEQAAEEMAQGALDFSHADIALSSTGIAGPDGGTTDKPVGLVFFGLAMRSGFHIHYKCVFSGDRENVRKLAVTEALKLLLSLV